MPIGEQVRIMCILPFRRIQMGDAPKAVKNPLSACITNLVSFNAERSIIRRVFEGGRRSLIRGMLMACRTNTMKPIVRTLHANPISSNKRESIIGRTTPPMEDPAHENVKLLLRDLLYLRELSDAVKFGDFGRVEDILPDIAAIFRAAGSTNYSMEILHFLHNVKHVWTPRFA